jgi:hypothetical protein
MPPVRAVTGYGTNEFASQRYTRLIYPNCKNMQTSNVSIALINPTFTSAAYDHAFYVFYKKYGLSLSQGIKNITQDLKFLSNSVPNATVHTVENTFIKTIPQHLQSLLPNKLDLCILTDQDLQKGHIFSRQSYTDSLNRLFDIVIIFHEEYVTPKIYEILERFVLDGGTLIVMSGNPLYAEVRYNENSNKVTLVNGHGFAFNNKTAFKGLIERWENETKIWEGSNFYRYALPEYPLRFYNNPFNAGGPEINYVSNKNARIILDYHSSDLRYPVAAYILKSGAGKVISTGVDSSVIRYPNFFKFFDDLLINYANPKNISLSKHVPPYYSPPYRPKQFVRNSNDFIFDIVGNQTNNRIHIGSISNQSSLGTGILRIIGKTENKPIRFITQPFHYKGNIIKLTLGDVVKYGNLSKYEKYDTPIMFIFNVQGSKSQYKVAFVQGWYWRKGWDANTKTYYVGTSMHNFTSLSLDKLLKERGDTYIEINRMAINIPQSTVVNPLDFQINIVK